MRKRARSEPEPEPAAIGALPPETLIQIFEALDARSLGRAAQACRLWRALVYPIARPSRFRDPGFARIASSDFAATLLVRYRDVFVGVRGFVIKVWDARGNPAIHDDVREFPSHPGCALVYLDEKLGLAICSREDGTSTTCLETRAEPFDLALGVELDALGVSEFDARAIRVLTPEREVLFEARGHAFAVVGGVIAIASEAGTTFWACPK